MQRAFLVDLNDVDRDEDTHFYVCRQCHTHIALLKNFLSFLTVHGIERVTSEVVNVQVDDEPTNHWQVGDRTLADVYCATCRDHLGVRYVAPTLSDDLEQTIEEVWYNLQIEKLSKWNASGPIDNQQEGNGSGDNQLEGQLNANLSDDNQQGSQSNGSADNQQESQLNVDEPIDNQQRSIKWIW